MLTKKEFWGKCQPAVTEQCAQWGFRAEQQGIFMRPLDNIWHGLAIVMNWHGPDSFYVLHGVHVPALHGKMPYITDRSYRGFEIDHRLGTYRKNGMEGTDVWYQCRDMRQLDDGLARMFRDFEAWALPWYERFRTLHDVAAEFRRTRIDDPPGDWPKGAGPRPPDPFGWAMYGWMLEEIGHREEANLWLHKAYDEVTKPLYTKDGRMVPEGVKGARKTRHPPEEERLEELLRQSLQLPVK